MSTATTDVDPKNWPLHVADRLKLHPHQCFPTAVTSQGNGLISRHAIFRTNRALKSYDPENILVGIIWSGPARVDFYQYPAASLDDTHSSDVVDSGSKPWKIINVHWDDIFSKTWYKFFSNEIGALVNSCEHILRTQWFLQKHKVKYFMGCITQEVFPQMQLDHPEIRYLYDLIDFSHFLPIEQGLYEWARDCSGLTFSPNDLCHLSTEQNILLTDQVIIPFLRKMNYV